MSILLADTNEVSERIFRDVQGRLVQELHVVVLILWLNLSFIILWTYHPGQPQQQLIFLMEKLLLSMERLSLEPCQTEGISVQVSMLDLLTLFLKVIMLDLVKLQRLIRMLPFPEAGARA